MQCKTLDRYKIIRVYVCLFCLSVCPKYSEPALASAGPWQDSEAMASAEREPITEVRGGALSGGPGAEPPVGVQGAKPPEA